MKYDLQRNSAWWRFALSGCFLVLKMNESVLLDSILWFLATGFVFLILGFCWNFICYKNVYSQRIFARLDLTDLRLYQGITSDDWRLGYIRGNSLVTFENDSYVLNQNSFWMHLSLKSGKSDKCFKKWILIHQKWRHENLSGYLLCCLIANFSFWIPSSVHRQRILCLLQVIQFVFAIFYTCIYIRVPCSRPFMLTCFMIKYVYLCIMFFVSVMLISLSIGCSVCFCMSGVKL